MKQEHIDYFAKFIEAELGIIYNEENLFQLQTRLQETMKFATVDTLDALYEKAKNGMSGALKQMLLDIATNNETSFFRDPKVFQGLSNSIFPEIISRLAPGETLRIWSAACSFGQEPYSIAMLLNELGQRLAVPKFEITATDISSNALQRAESGKYSQLEVQRGLAIPLLIKYFTKDKGDYWTIKPEISSHIHFKKKNLKDSFADLGKFHLILCRNVLIYQKVEAKADIITRLAMQLLQKGYLVLGSAESLLGISTEFNQAVLDGMVVHQTKAA